MATDPSTTHRKTADSRTADVQPGRNSGNSQNMDASRPGSAAAAWTGPRAESARNEDPQWVTEPCEDVRPALQVHVVATENNT